ncbi:MAG TPA: hypothetical protein VF450_23100 [Noviherbaspirillum sp.]
MAGVSRSSSSVPSYSPDSSNPANGNDDQIKNLMKKLEDGSISKGEEKMLSKLTGISLDNLDQMKGHPSHMI